MGCNGEVFSFLNAHLVNTGKIFILWKNTSNTPVDNESSLNITITVKIIELTDITIIEISVQALYLLVYNLIFNLPLLCTSCGNSKSACHPYKSS